MWTLLSDLWAIFRFEPYLQKTSPSTTLKEIEKNKKEIIRNTNSFGAFKNSKRIGTRQCWSA
jgi:hypothetical protein